MSELPPYRRTRIIRKEFAPGQRILMISDIHGHDSVFRAVLKKAAYTQDDALVIVGDLLEKGAESLKVIRTLMDMSASSNVYVLLGNMDVFTIHRLLSDDPVWRDRLFDKAQDMIRWWGGCLLDEMCRELGITLAPYIDRIATVRRLREHFAPELAWLSQLPAILDTPTITFVHGGLPHLRLDELEGAISEPYLKNDSFLSKGLSFDRYVAVGHWPTVLYRDRLMDMSPLILRDRHIVCLDGGCGVKRSGQLNCVILPDARSEDFSFVWADGLPHVRAVTDQAEGPEPTYIHYQDRAVDILQHGDEFSLVRYHGRETRVPTSALDPDNPGQLDTDMTDYRLPVSPGDEMSLIMHCGDEIYVRKDSILGWYKGDYTYVAENQ